MHVIHKLSFLAVLCLVLMASDCFRGSDSPTALDPIPPPDPPPVIASVEMVGTPQPKGPRTLLLNTEVRVMIAYGCPGSEVECAVSAHPLWKSGLTFGSGTGKYVRPGTGRYESKIRSSDPFCSDGIRVSIEDDDFTILAKEDYYGPAYEFCWEE